jgi:hypothetical protein
VFLNAVFRFYKERPLERGLTGGQIGSITVVQRFGSALNLNIHLHCLVLNGVFVKGHQGGSATFHPLPAPTTEQIEALLVYAVSRMERWLKRQGFHQPQDEISDEDAWEDERCDCHHIVHRSAGLTFTPGWSSACDNESAAGIGRKRTTESETRDEAWRCGVGAGTGGVRVEVGELCTSILPDTRAYAGNRFILLWLPEDSDSVVWIYEERDTRAQQEKYFSWRRVETGLVDAISSFLTAPPGLSGWTKSKRLVERVAVYHDITGSSPIARPRD